MKHLYGFRLVTVLAVAIALVGAAVVSRRTADSEGVQVVGRIGPTPGPNSEGHIEAQRAYLERAARADPERRSGALISLARFLSAPEAAELVGEHTPRAVFVLFPQSQPDALTVSQGIEATVSARAAELTDVVRAEVISLEARLRQAEGDRDDLVAALDERREALLALGPECACVYAIAVEGVPLATLQALSESPDVRLVDAPQPITASLSGWELGAILPPDTS